MTLFHLWDQDRHVEIDGSTDEQLREMPDTELAELTARLRGWTTDGLFLRDSGDPLMHKLHWTPAADIAQAYGLLTWLLEQRIATYQIQGLSVNPGIWIWRLKDETGFTVSSVDARAMVYAFVLAMEEVSK